MTSNKPVNNWLIPMSKDISFVEWYSIKKEIRSHWATVRHSNVFYEVHIILEGSCQVELNDQVYELSAGQAVLIAPQIFHCCHKTSNPFLRLTFSFMSQDEFPVSELISHTGFMIFETTQPMQQTCYSIFDELDSSISHLNQEMMGALFSQLLIHLLRIVQPGEEKEPALLRCSSPALIDCYFSNFNIPGGHTRKGLSALLHCSERQLNRILFNLYGKTFQEKRLQARMDHAQFLLRNTVQSIPEISAQVGYSSETSFYKVFKSTFGITPRDFRIKCRATPDEED